jgi:hypothetical protein
MLGEADRRGTDDGEAPEPDLTVRVAPHRPALAERGLPEGDLGQLAHEHDRLVGPSVVVDVVVVRQVGPDVKPDLARLRVVSEHQLHEAVGMPVAAPGDRLLPGR